MSFFTGFGVSCVVYLVLNWVWPAAGKTSAFGEVDLSGYDEVVEERYIGALSLRSLSSMEGTLPCGK